MRQQPRRQPRVALFAAAAAAVVAGAPRAAAEHDGVHLPAHFEVVEVGEFIKPVALAFTDGGALFVASKRGQVFFHDGVVKQDLEFIDLRDEIVQSGDRGLLGLALHPGFAADGGPTSWVYLLYTVSPVFGEDPLFNENDQYAFGRLTRYKAVASGSDVVADLATRQVLLGNQLPDGTVPDAIPSVHSSHANGTLVFGTDGSLLITCGEGAHFDRVDAGGLDPGAFESFTHPDTGLKGPLSDDQDCGAFRAQDLRSLGGKVLRVDPSTGFGYPSNPFYDGDPGSNASRAWALGLRNPYRAALLSGTGSTDPADGNPGTLLVGDVGWQDWEEINRCEGGENFGWPCFEGPFPEPGYETVEHDPNPFGFPDCGDLGPGVLTFAAMAWEHDDPSLLVPAGVHVDENGVPQSGFIGSCVVGGATYPGGDYPAEYAGRHFFADYADDWIRTAVVDPALGVTEIADFAHDVDLVVDLEAHPVTGDVYFCELGVGLGDGRVHRIRYGANLTPVAQLSADPLHGDPPLLVTFDASGSSDPEQDPLTYSWDFGDGSPPRSGVTVQHSFADEGLFTVTLTVTDDGGLFDTETVQIAVGSVPPAAVILTPLAGTLFDAPQEIELSGTGTDFTGEQLALEWSVDLYHDTHVHPGFVTLDGAQATLAVEPHGDVDELYYLRIELTARNETGLEGTDHLFVYPSTNLVDVTGTSLPISRMDELVPPHPTGSGNHDVEVVRDEDFPPVGSTDRERQYDTYHDGDQGTDDWVGFELTYTPADTVRFTSLVFQEGLHFSSGGWFEDFTVEVRDGGTWTEVENLRVQPPYPFELAQLPGFDGVGYQTYDLQFDPVAGEAVRLRGDPGGALGYMSVGELRARLVTPVPVVEPWADVTEGGSVIAKVFELSPPYPLGEGNPSPLVIHNQTWPPVGSASKFAQVDTFHEGDQGDEDWVGYAYDDWRLFGRVLFQEGFHYPNGGWFDTIGVEVRDGPGSPWQPVTGLSVSPPLPGGTSAAGSYETFELVFDPAVAREIRVIGQPGGADDFISIGELRVETPGHHPDECGWTPYGGGAAPNDVLVLESTTPPFLGAPAVLVAGGASGAVPGWIVVGAAPLSLPVAGGTLLVDPTGGLLDPIPFDANGTSTVPVTMPANPAFVGQSFHLQVLAADAPVVGELLFSNGLELRVCP